MSFTGLYRLLAGLCLATAALAQSSAGGGTLQGNVKDSTGAATHRPAQVVVCPNPTI
jgi:hypothetical protein